MVTGSISFALDFYFYVTCCVAVTVIPCLEADPNLGASDYLDFSGHHAMDYNDQDDGQVTCFWHWQEAATLLLLI